MTHATQPATKAGNCFFWAVRGAFQVLIKRKYTKHEYNGQLKRDRNQSLLVSILHEGSYGDAHWED